jgi:hypothetical protein
MNQLPKEILTIIMVNLNDSRAMYMTSRLALSAAPAEDLRYWSHGRQIADELPRFPLRATREAYEYVRCGNIPMLEHSIRYGLYMEYQQLLNCAVECNNHEIIALLYKKRASSRAARCTLSHALIMRQESVIDVLVSVGVDLRRRSTGVDTLVRVATELGRTAFLHRLAAHGVEC